MGWRFRHSFKVIPGVHLNLSKSGLSCSIGGAPLTVNVGPRGVYGTASLPGSGISYRERIVTPDGTNVQNPALPPTSDPPATLPTPALPIHRRTPFPVPIPLPIEEVRSASTELLTSESLMALKRLIQTAHEERENISGHLKDARDENERVSECYWSWQNGFLMKKIFKNKFAVRRTSMETAAAKVEELECQLHLTTVAAHLEIGKDQAEPYFRMRDQFASMSECAAIWDIKLHQTTDKFHERTTANMRVGRERVNFSLDSCELIQWEQQVPHLRNAKGGDLFLYPGFILYRAAREAFSVIDFHDVKASAAFGNFQEEEGVPKDSAVIGQSWAKANKDGSRDMRFRNNHPIPIVRYASLTLKSSSGLWEEFQFPGPERLERWFAGWNAFVASFQA
jgi:hypothetical protein